MSNIHKRDQSHTVFRMKLISLLAFFILSIGKSSFAHSSILVKNCKQVVATATGVNSSVFKNFKLDINFDKSTKTSYINGIADDFKLEAQITLTKRKKNLALLGMGDDDEMYWNRHSSTPGDAFPGYIVIDSHTGSVDVFYLPYGEYDSDDIPQQRAQMLETFERKARLLVVLHGCEVNRKLLMKVRGNRFD